MKVLIVTPQTDVLDALSAVLRVSSATWRHVATVEAGVTASQTGEVYDVILADYAAVGSSWPILYNTFFPVPLILLTTPAHEVEALRHLPEGVADCVGLDRLLTLDARIEHAVAGAQTQITYRRLVDINRGNEVRLKLLNSLLIGVTSGLSIEEIIQRVLQRLAHAFPHLRVLYAVMQPDGDLEFVQSMEPPGHPTLGGGHITPSQVPDYLAALRRFELVAVPEVKRDPRFAPWHASWELHHARAILDVPLRHSGRLLGVLGFNAFEPHEWSDLEVTALTEIADYLSLVLQEAHALHQRRQAEQQLEQRVRQLGALSHMGQAVVANLEAPEVLRQVVDEAILLVQADSLAVELLSDDGQALVFAAVGGRNATQLINHQVPSHAGIAGEVLRTGKAIRWPDPHRPLTIAIEVLRQTGDYAPQSVLATPLRWRDQYLGVIVATHAQANAFADDDLYLLETAADWAAIAISNARHFAETRETLAREKQLYEVTRILSANLDLPTTLPNVVQLAAQLVGAQAGALALLDHTGSLLNFPYVYNLPEHLRHPAPRGKGVSWSVVDSRQAICLTHYAQHPQANPVWVEAGVQGFIGVPLVVGEAVLGVLALFTLSPDKQFTPRDLVQAELVGRQASVAIQNAQLFEAERRRVQALTTVTQTGLDLSAELDLPTLLRTVIERASRMLDVEFSSMYMLQPDRQTLEMVVGIGEATAYTGTRLKLGEGIAGLVAQTNLPTIVQDYQQWAGRAAAFTTARFHAAIGVPIRWQGVGLLGVMALAASQVGRFTNSDIEVVSMFADQAAVAIINMRQHTNLRRRLQESEAMAAISRALNETLNTDRILQMIVDAARRIIAQVERAVIHLLDEEQHALRPAAVAGVAPSNRPEVTMRPGAGVAGQVMADGIVINVGDILTDPRYLPLGRTPSLRSLLVAPVQSGQRRLGTISVQSAAPQAFSADDEWLLATLGVQAALAIENARLFEVERRRAQEAEALHRATLPLISRLNLTEMLQAVVSALTTSTHYKYISIFTVEGQELACRAQTGYNNVPERLSITQGIVGRVARTNQPAYLPDVQRDADYIVFAPLVRSLIAVPLIHANQILGVLAVEAEADRPLDQGDVNWLTNVGRQMSVAIQNTRLVTDLEKALQQEKAARAQRVQTEKLAAMGRLVASVAHELNNPLQAMQNALYLVKLEAGLSPQAREDLQVAVSETERMAGLISRLRETYRPATREDFQSINLNDLVADVQRLLATHMRHNQVTCTMQLAPNLPHLSGLRDQLKQAVLNLCLNAIEAMSAGGQLTIQTSFGPATPPFLCLTITDTGAGIAPEALSNIFDPFFTTKDSGTGLGLAITHDIIQRHQGRIEVESQIGRGTTFRAWFPTEPGRV